MCTQSIYVHCETKVQQVTINTDDAGGGGDNGKSIYNGGGGEGDGGDDDDYSFGDGEDGGDGDGDGFFRKVLPQLYDKISIGAVLSEWYRYVCSSILVFPFSYEDIIESCNRSRSHFSFCFSDQ